MTNVYITFTTLAQRWEIAVRDVPVISEMEPVTERLWVGRDATNTVREVVLDAVTWNSEELALAEEFFGSSVRAAVEHLIPSGDLELVVRLTQGTALDVMGQSGVALPGEPGIPVPIEGNSAADRTVYEVPAPFDPELDEANSGEVAEIHLRQGEMRVVLPRGTGNRDLWVRISAATTGSLLHIAPVQPSALIEVTWGLDDDLQKIHLRVTHDPTAPVGDQTERRVQWAENLLTQSGGDPADKSRAGGSRAGGFQRGARKRVKIRDRRRAAEEAEQIAEAIGDENLRNRARAQKSLITKWRLARFGFFLTVAVVAGALMGSAFLSSDNGGQLDNQPNGQPDDQLGGEVGPVVFTYPDRTTVRALILGGVPEFRPGNQMSLTATLSTVILMGFSDPDISLDVETATQRARTTCLEVQNTSAEGNTYNYPGRNMIVRLSQLDEVSGAPTISVVAEVLDLDLRWNRFSSIQETCNSPAFGPGNRYSGEVVVSSFPINYEVTIPRNLPAGLWDVELLLEDQPIAVDGALRLRVLR